MRTRPPRAYNMAQQASLDDKDFMREKADVLKGEDAHAAAERGHVATDR